MADIVFTTTQFFDEDAAGHPQPNDPYMNAAFLNAREVFLAQLVIAHNLKAEKSHAHRPPSFTISANGTYTINALLGDMAVVTATANITLGPPSNPSDGQRIHVEIFANANLTISLATAIANATNRSFPISVLATQVTIIGLYYSARAGHWLAEGVSVEP